ncbi:DNA -binding domain-containing protein [Chelativorans xinjiangense]|uniref:DNA -binding domain-containing protein n=1 Tax=Chelativorans xinjiangense TaxID=2681485 RepID=UPI003CCD37BA
MSGSSLLTPVRLHSAVLWSPPDVTERLKGIESLNSLWSTGALPSRFFLAEPRQRRLRTVLRALDGSMADASHREIAIALFGLARISKI